MNSPRIAAMMVAGALAGVPSLAGCGGAAKGADSPGACPEGSVLEGSDCVPSGAESGEGDHSTGRTSGGDSSSSSPTAASAPPEGAGGGQDSPPAPASGDATPYDQDAVSAELKRAAREVKSSCGSATDGDGQATGPWGSTKASITLGRNGHVKHVSVPSPYDGKPAGICAVRAFQRIVFPPYAGSTDVVIDWDVDIVQPKHHG